MSELKTETLTSLSSGNSDQIQNFIDPNDDTRLLNKQKING